ncbi:MAG: type II secretion system GspH family protein [Mollicutes bacterium]|nr:type II secretion system GspH family protein [Mollicutes bacterium]
MSSTQLMYVMIMNNNKYKQGFTLTELIVAMVISSIVLATAGYFLVSFTNTSKDVKALQERTYEQNVVVKCFEKFTNTVNLEGKSVEIIPSENGNITIRTGEAENVNLLFIDNEKHMLRYNANPYTFEKITSINVVQDTNNPKTYVVTITFDNEKTYEFPIFIISQEGGN